MFSRSSRERWCFSLFLSVITLFTAWPYPLVPIHLTVISAMTIGIPSFILTFEPKYDRVQGKFLPSVLRRAFPGGLSNVFVVLVCQLFMVVFDLPQEEVSTLACRLFPCYIAQSQFRHAFCLPAAHRTICGRTVAHL